MLQLVLTSALALTQRVRDLGLHIGDVVVAIDGLALPDGTPISSVISPTPTTGPPSRSPTTQRARRGLS